MSKINLKIRLGIAEIIILDNRLQMLSFFEYFVNLQPV